MSAVVIVAILFIVPAVFNIISTQAAKHDSPTTDHFVMRPGGGTAVIGWICSIFFMICIIWSSLAGQFSGFLAVVFGCLFIIGILLILMPVKGFWDVTVDGDNVTSTRLWVFRKTIRISDIDYCSVNSSGIHIYLKDGRKAMTIDSMSTNISNWEKRMKAAGIEIRRPKQY